MQKLRKKAYVKTAIYRTKTPDKMSVKKEEFPSLGLSPEMKQASKRAETLPAASICCSLPKWCAETVDFMNQRSFSKQVM